MPLGWSVWLRNGGKLAFVLDGTGGLTGTEFFGNTFVDDNQPNLKVSINIDKIFSKQEILERLKKKRASAGR